MKLSEGDDAVAATTAAVAMTLSEGDGDTGTRSQRQKSPAARGVEAATPVIEKMGKTVASQKLNLAGVEV